MNLEISKFDKSALNIIRKSVEKLITESQKEFDFKDSIVLDIAPQIWGGAQNLYKLADIHTLDIDPKSNSTWIADLCKCNSDIIPDNYFDAVICTEVLEHVENPFSAVKEILRILKPGGKVYASTPFNFRIHGPLPDNWRFTAHGLKILFNEFRGIEIEEVNTPGRNLSPVHYRLIGQK